ncbi:MAG: hypothetical protein J6W64_09845 [Bacilli bacterium]|nr:hypothetical protein [Bacilli bacterium]MBO7504714.1 hypothetical protein [bacterium]
MIKENVLIKKDTSENWSKAKNFIPKKGEVIIYIDFEPNGIKIGDGKTKVTELPFINNNEYFIEDEETLVINMKGGSIEDG